HQCSHAEPYEIRRAGISNRRKRDGRRAQHGRQSERRGDDVKQRAGADPEDREQPGSASLIQTASDDVQHRGSGDDEKPERRGDKQSERGGPHVYFASGVEPPSAAGKRHRSSKNPESAIVPSGFITA